MAWWKVLVIGLVGLAGICILFLWVVVYLGWPTYETDECQRRGIDT
jgi:hypothetical protein